MDFEERSRRPYPDLDRLCDAARGRARRIRLLATDVDGVLTDGGLYFGPAGETFKRFHTRDGSGMVVARQFGIEVAIITGRVSEIVAARAAELGIKRVYQGERDKGEALAEMLSDGGFDLLDAAFVGDDIQDLPAFSIAGFSACPADAHPAVAGRADYICSRPGGSGALREVVDLLLAAKGLLVAVEERFAGKAPPAREKGPR